jgi:phosphate transport system protein
LIGGKKEMQAQFSKAMENLKKNITQMATLVNNQLDMAIQSLEEKDVGLVLAVKERDKEIDAYENLIQAQCENMLALYQPVAVDLRYVMTAMMMNNQLERCGDIAVNIVQRVKKMVTWKDFIDETVIVDMARQSQTMVNEAIGSFLNNEIETAKKVMQKDDIVDDYNKKIFHFLVEKIKTQPDLAEPGAHLIVLSRHLERLADHATNIAEDVVFLIEDQIVAHKKLK